MTVVLALATAAAGAGRAEDTSQPSRLDTLLRDGEIGLNFRYRYEFVDQDCCDPTQPPGSSFDKDANASTLRSRLSLKSGTLYDTHFFIEVEDVRTIVLNDYNAGGGNTISRQNYPEVNDPETTEINQAYVDYAGLDPLRLRLGRQRVDLDNQRFVGSVGWRQNDQTLDAFAATYDHASFDVFYGYVRKVHRIFGDEVPAGKQKQDNTQLVNISTDVDGWGKLVGYYYYIDNQDAPPFSTWTAGARFAGERPLDRFKLRYQLEYAYQEDSGNNPSGYDADYFHAELGVGTGSLDAGLGYELLSGDDDGRFVTPLATLHAFNGWADKFIAGGTGNPVGGLEDTYVNVSYTFGPYLAEVRYHDFQSDYFGDGLGQEVDLRFGRPLSKRLRGDLYYADFNGEGDFSDTDLSDTRKFWVQLMFSL